MADFPCFFYQYNTPGFPSRIAEFNLNDFPQLILESLFAPCFHLPFGKSFLVAARAEVECIRILLGHAPRPQQLS